MDSPERWFTRTPARASNFSEVRPRPSRIILSVLPDDQTSCVDLLLAETGGVVLPRASDGILEVGIKTRVGGNKTVCYSDAQGIHSSDLLILSIDAPPPPFPPQPPPLPPPFYESSIFVASSAAVFELEVATTLLQSQLDAWGEAVLTRLGLNGSDARLNVTAAQMLVVHKDGAR